MKKAEQILKPHQIIMVKQVLGFLTIAPTKEGQENQKYYLQKWFDFNLDYTVRAEIEGQYFKLIYTDFFNPENQFEITKD